MTTYLLKLSLYYSLYYIITYISLFNISLFRINYIS